MQDGLHRMYGTDDSLTDTDRNVIYYLTVYNEPMAQPAEPENVDREGILRGMYLYAEGSTEGLPDDAPRVQLLALRSRHAVGARGPGAAAQRLERRRRRVVGDVVERAAPRRAAVRRGRVPPPGDRGARAVGDPEALRPARARSWRCPTTCGPCRTRSASGCRGDFASLGADGFGFSDTRPAARRFFHIDGPSMAVRALQALAERGEVDRSVPLEAARRYRLSRRHRGLVRQRGRRQLTRPSSRGENTPHRPSRRRGVFSTLDRTTWTEPPG